MLVGPTESEPKADIKALLTDNPSVEENLLRDQRPMMVTAVHKFFLLHAVYTEADHMICPEVWKKSCKRIILEGMLNQECSSDHRRYAAWEQGTNNRTSAVLLLKA